MQPGRSHAEERELPATDVDTTSAAGGSFSFTSCTWGDRGARRRELPALKVVVLKYGLTYLRVLHLQKHNLLIFTKYLHIFFLEIVLGDFAYSGVIYIISANFFVISA